MNRKCREVKLDTKTVVIIVAITICVVTVLSVVAFRGQDLDKPEGSLCSWENLTGTCVDARKCTTFQVDVEKKNQPPICSFQGQNAIICCTACVIKTSLDPPPPPIPKLLAKCQEYYAKLPYKCRPHVTYKYGKELQRNGTCYQNYHTETAPIGGDDALRNQFPHMALLGYGPEQDTAKYLCAGSIISEKYILTAGHCASQPQLGPVTIVALGILKRSDPQTLWQRYRVKRFIPHPKYRAPSKYDDIALIEVETPIKFSESVMPACVGEKDIEKQENVDYNTGYALGWGGLGHRMENADTLQSVTLKKFTTAECSALYPPHRHLLRGYDPSTQVCYGDHDQIRDTCAGDSGGPIIRLLYMLSCTNHVFGVTSYGLDCGFKGNAGIYTRVEPYETWIESIVFP